ncbi:hypothetical protein [Tumebacillus avium]|uniref:hypothetical protein n=1 Tax=Tumebacillus avium TaxID=1903704 RepID=UPI0012FDAB20|nr:hypothetical protein [Tumebacillus avium]
MNPERQPAAERHSEPEEKKDLTPLHYEFAKGYLPTVNPKSDETHHSDDTGMR